MCVSGDANVKVASHEVTLTHFILVDESICHFRGVGSVFVVLFCFDGKSS